MRPMRVVCVRDHLLTSGGTAELRRLFEHLDRSRIEPTLVVLGARTEESAAFEQSGVRPLHLGQKHHLFWAIRAARPDMLLLSGPKSQIWGSLAARWFGLPATHFFNHMMPISRIGRATYLAQRAAMRRRDRAITVSHTGKAWVIEQYGLAADCIDVIHPAIDVARFAAAAGPIGDGPPVLLLIGRVLFQEKGQHLMVEVMPRISTRYPDAVLQVIGDGPDLPELQRLITAAGLEDSIRLAGKRGDIPALIRSSTLVVLPSLVREGFPLVSIEAGAVGRPGVGFASGGLAESIRDGETGLLVPTGDTDALAEAILALLADPERLAAMGAAGQRFARDFTIERQVEAFTAHVEARERPARA